MPPYIYKYICPQNLVVDRRKIMAFLLTSEVLDQIMYSASDSFDHKYLHISTTHKAENIFKVNSTQKYSDFNFVTVMLLISVEDSYALYLFFIRRVYCPLLII